MTVPIVRRNLALVAAIPRQIAATELPVESLVLVIPTTAPDPDECAPLGEAAAAIAAVSDTARRVGVAVRLDASTFLSPCVFEKPERVAHLFALNRGHAVASRLRARRGVRRLSRQRPLSGPAAGSAGARRCRCPSLHPVARRSAAPPSHRRLVGRGADRARARRPRRAAQWRVPSAVAEYTVRVNFHCNQSCEFCFVSTHLPPPAEAAVRDGDRGRRTRGRRARAVGRRADVEPAPRRVRRAGEAARRARGRAADQRHPSGRCRR